jgi:hypothetical protein
MATASPPQPVDRLSRSRLSRCCKPWRSVLVPVQPESVIRWHHSAWRRWREPLTVVQPTTVLRWRRTPWWRHLRGRRRRRGGRPRIDPELQVLIQHIDAENLLWGSLRITGELRKLGFTVGNSTVRRYRLRVRRRRPTQSWGKFFSNHAPYLREALLDELRDGTRRLLELLLDPPRRHHNR